MATDPTVDFPRKAGCEPLQYVEDPQTLTLHDRLALVQIAHATTDVTIRKHALLLLEHAANPGFYIQAPGGPGGITPEEWAAQIKRWPAP